MTNINKTIKQPQQVLLTKQAEQAARENPTIKKLLDDGWCVAGFYEYQDKDGNPIYWRVRLDPPLNSKEKKWIRPFSYDDNKKKWLLKEPDFFKNGKKPLYLIPSIIKAPDDAIIYVVEGEKCADALSKLGIVVTTSGSATSAAKADWCFLQNRSVIIWRDNDGGGFKYAQEVTEILLGLDCDVQWIDIEKLQLPDGGDCVDWLTANPKTTRADVEALQKTSSLVPQKADEQDDNNPKSAVMVDLVIKNYELFHNSQNAGYATTTVNNHKETWDLESLSFQSWLRRLYWDKFHKPAIDAVISTVVKTLVSHACYNGGCEEVYVRCANKDGSLYIDLANKNWEVVRVNAQGWELVKDSPVKFTRSSNMLPLPNPQRDGDINNLWEYTNIPEEYRKLVLAWILESYRINTDYPILAFKGSPGTAKSTTQETIRMLVDPSIANLNVAPKKKEDFPVNAANNYLVSYNNVSNLTGEQQDDLCCMSTGGSYSTRKLYTTFQEMSVNIKRPVMFNGIEDVITAPDLIDRSIVLDLQEISSERRKRKEELETQFKKECPRVFGALLDILVKVLGELPNVVLEAKPRMADFAILGEGLEKAMGWTRGSFMMEYEKNRNDSMANALEHSPVAMSLINYINENDYYNGSYKDLYNALNERAVFGAGGAWVKSPKGLANQLKRQAIALRAVGIEITFDNKRHDDGYHVSIKVFENNVQQVQEVRNAMTGGALEAELTPEHTNLSSVSTAYVQDEKPQSSSSFPEHTAQSSASTAHVQPYVQAENPRPASFSAIPVLTELRNPKLLYEEKTPVESKQGDIIV